MTLAEFTARVDVDSAIGQILRAADDALDPETAAQLHRAALIDRTVWEGASGVAPVSQRLGVKATDGSDLLEVLRVLVAALRAGLAVELSLGRPLADRLHRGLLRAGTPVRVETTDRWAARVGRTYDRIRVVGPERSRHAALRRTESREDAAHVVADTGAVDLTGTRELDALLRPRPLPVLA